ncbi:adenylosuccinate lyase [Sarotherodon galilaeus]
MGRWKLWFALFLLLFCTGTKAVQEHRVKTISKEPDVTPLCTNETMNVITMIVCKIQTERSRGENCSLMYRHGQDFKHECDSRFMLMTENQTVFLHLTNVTPEDSGNYTCECVRTGGADKLYLSVTVEEFLNNVDGVNPTTNSSAEVTFFYAATGSAVCIIISGVILGLVYSTKYHRRRHAPITIFENTELYTVKCCTLNFFIMCILLYFGFTMTPCFLLQQAEPIEPYEVFMQTENLIYDL